MSTIGLLSTYGVALVRIYDAGLKRAARGSLEMQDPKKIFKTSDRNIVESCQEKLGFVLPSIQLDKRRKNLRRTI